MDRWEYLYSHQGDSQIPNHGAEFTHNNYTSMPNPGSAMPQNMPPPPPGLQAHYNFTNIKHEQGGNRPWEEDPVVLASRLVFEQIGTKLLTSVAEAIKAEAVELTKNIRKLLDLRDKTEKFAENIETFKQLKVPKTMTKWKPLYESDSLDLPLTAWNPAALLAEMSAKNRAPVTFRDAMCFAFHFSKVLTTSIDGALAEQRIQKLEAATDYDGFLQRCAQKKDNHIVILRSLNLKGVPARLMDEMHGQALSSSTATVLYKRSEMLQLIEIP